MLPCELFEEAGKLLRLGVGGCQVIKPGGPRVGETSRLLKFIETGDPLTTNIAFGGDELDTAFITVRLRAATALRLSPAVSKTQRLIVRVCGRR